MPNISSKISYKKKQWRPPSKKKKERKKKPMPNILYIAIK
jgi:hypothetical protein